MRSPMTTNGRSKPITTSRVFELMTVSVMTSLLRQAATRLDAGLEERVVEAAFQLRHPRGDERFDVPADLLGLPAPVGEIGVAGPAAGAHGGAVDRARETRRQLLLEVAAALASHDLRGNVAPVNADQLRHWTTCSVSERRNGSSPVKCTSSGRPR